ncbi:MAG: GNAT family N-acetyltransferase [Planctomycetota bacterium]|jgi:putative acetyltransferase
MDVRLREATDGDSEGVIALVGRVFAEYPGCVLDVDGEEPELRSPASSFDEFWVLEREGEIVGSVGLAVLDGDRVELKKLYLDESVRGRGLARRLAERVEERARALGAGTIELWSDTRFTAAHGFYERLGYARTGRSRDLNDLSRTTEHHFEKSW